MSMSYMKLSAWKCPPLLRYLPHKHLESLQEGSHQLFWGIDWINWIFPPGVYHFHANATPELQRDTKLTCTTFMYSPQKLNTWRKGFLIVDQAIQCLCSPWELLWKKLQKLYHSSAGKISILFWLVLLYTIQWRRFYLVDSWLLSSLL